MFRVKIAAVNGRNTEKAEAARVYTTKTAEPERKKKKKKVENGKKGQGKLL